jgi:hypothetical protein
MELNFRQGILKRQTDISNSPIFIQKSSFDNRYLDLIVSPDPTVFAISHFDSNYLIEETNQVTHAWGPLAPTGETQYLYWDVSMLDASLTRGYTALPPIVTTEEPLNPKDDQHWYDLNSNVYKVFKNNKWQVKLRCFAAIYDKSAQVIPYPIGSQVGIFGGQYASGNIILGKSNKPLRDSDGTFVTSESSLIIARTSAEAVKFDATLAFAEANENIPKFSLVSLLPKRRVALASFLNTSTQIHGMITNDLSSGETGQIISNGLVRNEQWNFTDAQIGKPLFCGPTGQITLTPPISGMLQQIGSVYDTDSIYVNIFAPVLLTQN